MTVTLLLLAIALALTPRSSHSMSFGVLVQSDQRVL